MNKQKKLHNILNTLNYKPEIDSIRAIAVFFVIFFHFELLKFTGGFIGVDIFFVISGYLITGLLLTDLKGNNFSLLEFYGRRIRRILPALYTIIFVSLILGYLILSPIHLNRLGESSFSSVLGISNFFFWYEYGYFDFKKLYKPLLHTWSLSVELQFYLVWPIFIFFLYKLFKTNLKIIVFVVILLSLIFSSIYSARTTGFFYFPGFRLYEFAIGSFTFLIKDDVKIKINNLIAFISIFILFVASLTFDEKSIFPGYNALIPSVATSLLLLSTEKANYIKSLLLNKTLIYFGKISYSLYLIHWPLIIFYKYMFVQQINFVEKIFLLIVTIILSSFSYNYIELPFRRKKNKKFILSNKKIIFYLISFASTIILISYLFIINKGFENRINNEKINTLNKLKNEVKIRVDIENNIKTRHQKNIFFNENKNDLNILIMGNSHAFDLYWALISNNNFSSNLNIDLKSFDFTYFKKTESKDNIAEFIKKNIFRNYKIKQAVKRLTSDSTTLKLLSKADIIILSSRWDQKTDFEKIIKYLKTNSQANIIITSRIPVFIDIPTLYFKFDKNLNYVANLKRDLKIDAINQDIKTLAKKFNVKYYDRTKLVCKENKCIVINNNNLLYTDSDHWSQNGVIYYGQKLYEDGFLDLINSAKK